MVFQPKSSPSADPRNSASADIGTQKSPRKKQWTFGDSRQLKEGEHPEPLHVTVGWIAIPIIAFLLLISLLAV